MNGYQVPSRRPTKGTVSLTGGGHNDNAGAGSEEKGIKAWVPILTVTSFHLDKEIVGTVSPVSGDPWASSAPNASCALTRRALFPDWPSYLRSTTYIFMHKHLCTQIVRQQPMRRIIVTVWFKRVQNKFFLLWAYLRNAPINFPA